MTAFAQIPNLPAGIQIGGNEQFEAVQAGVSVKLTAAQILAYIGANLAGIRVGTTSVSNGSTGQILYDHNGVVGEYALTGTGTTVVMQTSPQILCGVVNANNLMFLEPGGLARNPGAYGSGIWFDMTNLAVNIKHGITFDIRTTNTAGTINTNGIIVNIYTPPDNGGDVSGFYALQTGGGNAASFFNLSAQRPGGFTQYANQGFALETQVDGGKHSIYSQVVDGASFYSEIGSSGNAGIGLLVKPLVDGSTIRRAIQVLNAAANVEKLYVDLAGNIYSAGTLVQVGLATFNGHVLIQDTTAQPTLLSIQNTNQVDGTGIYLNDGQAGDGHGKFIRYYNVGGVDALQILSGAYVLRYQFDNNGCFTVLTAANATPSAYFKGPDTAFKLITDATEVTLSARDAGDTTDNVNFTLNAGSINFSVLGVKQWAVNAFGVLLPQPALSDQLNFGGTSNLVKGAFFGSGGVVNNTFFTSMKNTAIGAGANTQALIKASTTANFGDYYGTGDPSFSAAKGSTYRKTNAAGTTDRFWINTNGTTGWTFFTSNA